MFRRVQRFLSRLKNAFEGLNGFLQNNVELRATKQTSKMYCFREILKRKRMIFAFALVLVANVIFHDNRADQESTKHPMQHME